MKPEMFFEDYRRKELEERRQRNMDSAFENIYHRSQVDSPSIPESPSGMKQITVSISILN